MLRFLCLRQLEVKLCVCENRVGWLVAWGLHECMLGCFSAVWILPFTLLYLHAYHVTLQRRPPLQLKITERKSRVRNTIVLLFSFTFICTSHPHSPISRKTSIPMPPAHACTCTTGADITQSEWRHSQNGTFEEGCRGGEPCPVTHSVDWG